MRTQNAFDMLEYVKVNALMLATRMNEMSERKTNSLYFSFIHEKMNPSESFCCGFVFSLENQNRTQTQPKLRFSWNMHVKNSRDTNSQTSSNFMQSHTRVPMHAYIGI